MKKKIKSLIGLISPVAEATAAENFAAEELHCQNPNCRNSLIPNGSQVLITDYKFFHSTEECQDYVRDEITISKKSIPRIHPYWSAQAVLRQADSNKFKFQKLKCEVTCEK